MLSFSNGITETLGIIFGWLAWAALFFLCINYKELGNRPLPFTIFVFGGMATIFFLSAPIIFFTGIWRPENDMSDGAFLLIMFAYGLCPSLLFIHLSLKHVREYKRQHIKE